MEVGARLVLLGDEDHPRDPGSGALGPHLLGADLDAVDRAHDQHREVRDRQRGIHPAREIGVPGGVDEIDLVRLAVGRGPRERRHGERERDAVLDLLRLEVAHGRAVLDASGPGDPPRAEQECLGERRLSAAAVAHEGHVPDLGRRCRVHGLPHHRWASRHASNEGETAKDERRLYLGQVASGIRAGRSPRSRRRIARPPIAPIEHSSRDRTSIASGPCWLSRVSPSRGQSTARAALTMPSP